MMPALSLQTAKAIEVSTARWIWAVDCRTYKPALLAVRCEQAILNKTWRLPRVFA